MTVKGQDERAKDFGAALREVCNEWVRENGIGPSSDWHVTRLLPLADGLDAALVGSEARERELETERDRWHEKFEADGLEVVTVLERVDAERAVLVEALKEIAYPPHDVDEGWFIRRARTALAGDGSTPREAIVAYHSANEKRITGMMVYLRQAEIIQRGIEGIFAWNGTEYDSEDVGRKARGILDAVLDTALAGVVEAEPDGRTE